MQRLIGIHPRPCSRIAAMRAIPRVFADSSLRGSFIGNNLRKHLRVSAFPGSATNTGVEAMSRKNSCWRIKTRIADPGSSGISQLAPPISRASSERTYPGGLPLRDRTSSQPSLEPTTLILVPRSICEITRADEDGSS